MTTETPFAGEYTMVDGVAVDPNTEPAPEAAPPIIADWLKTKTERHAVANTAVKRAWYGLMFHLTRLHIYWWRLARQSHLGIWRGIKAWARFTSDAEGLESLKAARSSTSDARGDVGTLHKQHRDAIKQHLAMDVVGLVVSIYVTVMVMAATPDTWRAPLLLASILVTIPILGFVGRDTDVPIVERWVSTGVVVPKLTEGLIIEALANALPKVRAAVKEHEGRAIRWIVPPSRITNGYECVVDLPDGVTVADAVKATNSIAGGLSRPESTVWLTELSEERQGHASRLRMVITDAPMRSTSIPEWPLADPDAGPFDIYKPIPLGINYLGEPVSITLMFRSGIVGAIPRMGKSFTLRLLCLAAALDPTVEIHLYDLKGGPDFKRLGRKVAHAFLNTQDEKHADDILDDLKAMDRDMKRRYETLDRIEDDDPARCPEGKVTRELSNDKRLGLHPVLLAIDETQTCFVDWDQRKEFEAIITRLSKMGPAVGIMVLLATQSVNSHTIPRQISVTAALRFCLKVTDHIETDQILGTGAYRKGYQASELSGGDLGIGYLAGEGTETQLVRCCKIDGPAAEEIAERARAVREATGWLSGQAAGDEPEDDDTPDTIVDHLLAIWPVDGQTASGRYHLSALAALLADEYPDIYGGHGAREVGTLARTHHLVTDQVKVDGRNRPGIRWPVLTEAAADRTLEEDNEEDIDDAA